jgi:predicted kinase
MTSQKLVVLSGLPGSGKSTLAEGLSRALSIPVLSVDPIEAGMRRSGLAEFQTGIAAYYVAQTLADEHLRLGHSVIIDAVNPVEAPRAAWRDLATKYRADLKIVECVCEDQTLHRQRIESRVRNIDGIRDITWAEVQEGRRSEYEPWTERRLVLDTSAKSSEQLLAETLNYVRAISPPP